MSAGITLGLATAPAGASTAATTYEIPTATATPQFLCGDLACGSLGGYTYVGSGTCSGDCVGLGTTCSPSALCASRLLADESPLPTLCSPFTPHFALPR